MSGAGGSGGESWERDAPLAWWERRSVLRMLRHDRWFVRVLLGSGFVFLVLMAGFVRWIPGTAWPDGRGWRLSGLGWVRCRWHDIRMGRAGEVGFQPDSARWSWRVGQDPADVQALRGYLDSLIADPSFAGSRVTNGLRWGAWLWRVGGTNRDDVRRMFRLAARVDDDGQVLSELSPWLPLIPASDAERWVLALAEQDRWDEVGRLLGVAPDLSLTPIGGLLGLAWQAGWGPAAGSLAALAKLDAIGLAGGEIGVKADQLLIQVLCRRVAVDEAFRVLGRLSAAGGARSMDRLRVARLGVAAGRVAAMKQEIVSWASPSHPREVLAWHQVLQQIGEPSAATRMLSAAVKRWERPEWCLVWVDGLIAAGEWVRLREAGAWLREGRFAQPGWIRLGSRLEAVANEKLGRTGEAAEAWSRGEGRMPEGDGMGWEWGRRLLSWGFPAAAADWILESEPVMAGQSEYWAARMRLAHATGDGEGVLTAALRVRLLSPGSLAAVNDHAAALLILRRDPAEALRLVRMAGVRETVGSGARINEALALAQMGQAGEAESLLAELELGNLTGMERTMVCLGRFEVHARCGRVAEAMEMYRAIEGRFLMAVQSRWLEAEYHRLLAVQESNPSQPRVGRP